MLTHRFILSFLLFFQVASLNAQFKSEPQFGIQAGFIMNIGSHVNSVGANLGFYYTDFFYQFNVHSQLKFNATSYGNRLNFWESRTAVGMVLLAGKKDVEPDFQIDGLSHQTKFSQGVAYNYLFFFDQAKTSQRSGAWAIHINYFTLALENDVFGNQQKDRFRTHIMQATYRHQEWKVFTNLFLWTGETAKSFWDKTPMFKAPSGVRRLNELPYGKTSHGIISFGASKQMAFDQVITLKVGYDSEETRHIVQNRVGHDLIFLPKSVKRNTPHYPRLNEEGMPVYEKKDVRKNQLFYQFNMNEIWSN
jgi:hypothetical protein